MAKSYENPNHGNTEVLKDEFRTEKQRLKVEEQKELKIFYDDKGIGLD